MDTPERRAPRASPLDALSIGYIKILKAFLTISASWPYLTVGGKVHPVYKYYVRCIIPFGLTAISLEVWFLIDHFNVLSLFEVGQMYLTCFFAALSIARMFLPFCSQYGEIVERFLLSFHLIHFKHKGSYHLKVAYLKRENGNLIGSPIHLSKSQPICSETTGSTGICFTDDMSALFGPVLAIYLLFHQVSGCILLLEISAGGPDAFTKYGPLTVTIFGQLIIISTIFEIVNTKSELLATTAYSMPWECMNVSNRRSVCILLRRLQRPIAVRALGVTAVNVQTMSTILKTSFSYFTFLRTLND
ncbi:uncharacterized protein LOC133534774 isoform X3 [Cydia pomonella]|uniref:uncharacterized protein LOC133534774 isoform X3 n=1 Tax=Cydia pomonella TaxID=82600 RepID=UPI002ADD6B99|nr:uncharacterized protein LOC133534774 isoform X3 [Cydia pomonella]